MPVISELPNGKWFYTYEWLNVEDGTGFELYYRIADDPFSVADAEDVPLLPFNSDTQPLGQPYNVWTPAGGPQGTIIAGNGGNTELYINKRLGDPDAWEEIQTPAGSSYSRSFTVLPNDPSRIMIISPGPNNSAGINEVLVTTIDIDDSDRPYPFPYTGHQVTKGKCAPRGKNPSGKSGKGHGKGHGKDDKEECDAN